ncbi:hypothetical protein LWM68_03195 [Niabella sp. W65]|nr:hypothetical protein [Niabella sp. W65]MCH7361872.1 hypothetical protein [Niabella sp. W65]
MDGVRIDMIQSGVTAQNAAQEKYTLAKRFTTEAGNLEFKGKEAEQAQDRERANALNRDAKETRTKAFYWEKKVRPKSRMHAAMRSMPTSLQKCWRY